MVAEQTRQELEVAIDRLAARHADVQRQLINLPDIATIRQSQASGLRAYLKELEAELVRLRRELDSLARLGE